MYNIVVVKTKSSSKVGNNGDSVKKKVAINEPQVDLLLEMLKTADITSTNKEENKTLKGLEGKTIILYMYSVYS